jgi:hypothetical protein
MEAKLLDIGLSAEETESVMSLILQGKIVAATFELFGGDKKGKDTLAKLLRKEIKKLSSAPSAQLEDSLQELLLQNNSILNLVGETTHLMTTVAPMVLSLEIENKNLWTNSQLSHSKKTTTERGKNFRYNLLCHLGCENNPLFRCMVSKKVGDHNQIVAAHIIPALSRYDRLEYVGMTPESVDTPRNGLLLAFGIEQAFDKLQLSFIKNPNVLRDEFIMKIWDDDIRNNSIWKPKYALPQGKDFTIGEFDNMPLILGNHQPFKRAILFQSVQAKQRYNRKYPLTGYFSDNNNSDFALEFNSINSCVGRLKEFLNVAKNEIEDEIEQAEEAGEEEFDEEEDEEESEQEEGEKSAKPSSSSQQRSSSSSKNKSNNKSKKGLKKNKTNKRRSSKGSKSSR